MNLPSVGCARALRDGGIDAVAALSDALHEAVIGLSPADETRVKRVFGRLIAEVIDQTIKPATLAFPELEPDEGTWVSVAKHRAAVRSRGA